jgi:exodeoxyribonuclease VII small subunit
MADERHSFEQARTRLEEIVTQVRKKDVSLETSLDLLEEGVRLANACTELSDHAEWRTVAEEQAALEHDVPPGTEAGDGAGTGDGDGENGAETPPAGE